MANAVKKCRVCGREYEACRSAIRSTGTFRWQDVACSPECGTIYLQQINESRGLAEPIKRNRRKRFEEVTNGDTEIIVSEIDTVKTIKGNNLDN